MNQGGGGPHLKLGIGLIVLCYLLASIAHYFPDTNSLIDQFVAEQLLNNNENAAAELLSALLWFCALVVFSCVLLKEKSHATEWSVLLWYALFCALCLFAFGEEISWGDHLFDYSDDLSIAAINAQGETNLHNIDLAQLIGLPESNPFHYWLSNLGHLLTPLFYFGLAVLWVFVPFIKQYYRAPQFLHAMPSASSATRYFFVIHGVAFLLIDTVFFNVGQIFEMFIGLFALLVAIDMYLISERGVAR